MHEVVEQITRVAERCEGALAAIWPALERAAADQSLQTLSAITEESRRTFADAMKEMVPTLDAIVAQHNDSQLKKRREELNYLRDAYPQPGGDEDNIFSKFNPQYVRAKEEAQRFAQGVGEDNVRVHFITTWRRRGVLGQFAEILRYFAQYLRTQHAIQAARLYKDPATYNLSVNNSTIGGIGAGEHPRVQGTVNQSSVTPLTQEQHRAVLKEGQKALIEDEDRLDARVHETLGLFLRRAREVQVEQRPLAEVQAEIGAVLDEVWTAKALQVQLLPKESEVAGVIAKHPAMIEVTRKLLGP